MPDNDDIIYQRVERYLGKYKHQLLNELPYNPQVLRTALIELRSNTGDFRSWGEVFRGDPSLQTRFLYEAQMYAQMRNKNEWRIDSMVNAVQVLGQRRTVEILEKALSDDLLEKFKRIDYREYELIWYECYYMAAIGRNLAHFFSISEYEAYSLCLLANIGHIILSQIFGARYLYAIVKNEQRLLNSTFNMLQTEREEFEGITHSDVGYWFLTFLGIGSEFANSAYRHELPDPDQLKSRRLQLVAYSHKISACLTKAYMIKHIAADVYEDRVIEELETNNTKQRFETIRLLQNKFGSDRNNANSILEKAEFEVQRIRQSSLTNDKSILEQRDYIQAINEIQEMRSEILDQMLSSLDLSITKYLPYPLAVDFSRLQDTAAHERPNGYLEIPSIATSIAENYTSIMNCTLLGYLYNHKKEQLISEILKQANNKNSYFLSMGGGVNFAKKIFDNLSTDIPPEKLPKIVGHYFRNTELIFRICEIRARTKNTSNRIDVIELIRDIENLLRDFALQQSEFFAVTDIELKETSDKQEYYRCEYISWSGTESLEARARRYVKSPRGLPKGSQMLILRENGENRPPFRIPKFLLFKPDSRTLRNYFFCAKQIFLHPRANKITVQMQPFNADINATNQQFSFDLPESDE